MYATPARRRTLVVKPTPGPRSNPKPVKRQITATQAQRLRERLQAARRRA